tara:strand:+ start:4573 stop:6183 length:1611 start_codon:yes stop_codon:yes gene_type:complete
MDVSFRVKERDMLDFENKLNQISLYLSGIWNRKRYIMLFMWMICLAGWSIVSFMGNKYETEARVYADTSNALQGLLEGLVVRQNAGEKVQTASRTFLNRKTLEDIAKSSDLYLKYPTPEEYEEMIKRLRDDIQITGSSKYNLYDISYQHTDPKMAYKIVELTLKKFVDANESISRTDSTVAITFLDEQIEDYKQRLKKSETELANFRKENKDHLPGQGNGYYASVHRLKENIEKLQLEIDSKASEIKGLKERFLPSSKDLKSQVAGSITTSYDERVERMRNSLEDLKIRYTDRHPDIQELSRRLQDMVALQNKERDIILRSASNGAMTVSGEGENLTLQQFSFKISELEAERDVLVTRQNTMKERLDELDSKLDLIPNIEAQLVELQRNYTNDQNYYQQLIKRRDSAEISKSVDEKTDDVKFKILDEPREATKPVGPPRIIFYIAVFILSVGVGVFAAFISAQLNSVVLGTLHLQKLVGENNVIGSVPHINKKKLARHGYFKNIVFFTSCSVLFIALCGLVAHEILFRQSPLMWVL